MWGEAYLNFPLGDKSHRRKGHAFFNHATPRAVALYLKLGDDTGHNIFLHRLQERHGRRKRRHCSEWERTLGQIHVALVWVGSKWRGAQGGLGWDRPGRVGQGGVKSDG